jgi:hypothetical protein
MHKGYTLNYFINFFKSIPDHRWTESTLQEEGTVRMCALGHCLAHQNSDASKLKLYNLRGDESNGKVEALQHFLSGYAAEINDGRYHFDEYGKTPRGRILKALRLRKRGVF